RCAARRACTCHDRSCGLRWPCRRRGWLPCWRAGTPRKSAASHGSCTGCSAPPTPYRRTPPARWVLRWPFLWLSILPCSAPAPPTACACWQPARKRPATTRGPAARASRASRCDRFPPQQRSLEMGVDLPLIWAVIILFGVMMYVVMDGFDLGIGILFPFFQDTADRDVMMNTVAPVWDGNETWLVLGGAGLLAAFPLAYAVVLSALHLPLILMLTGLIFRGVAFE